MHLKELRRSGGKVARYVGTLADVAGAQQYEISISGPRKLAEKVLAKSDFDIRIDSRASERDAQGLSRELWDRYATRDPRRAPAEGIESLRKRLPKPASPDSSLVIALQRTEGEGTFWAAFFPVLLIPRGVSLFFVLPPICNCFGTVFPQIGDTDLFLTTGGPFTPVVAASVRGGTAIDSVAFGSTLCWPWTQVMPWFRVFGFTTTQTAFLMSGFSTFP
jgi:hypothetical protein